MWVCGDRCGTEISRYSPDPAVTGQDDSAQLAVHLSCIGAVALHNYTNARGRQAERETARQRDAPTERDTDLAREGDTERESETDKKTTLGALAPAVIAIPEVLEKMLLRRECTFHSGLRVGARACKGADEHFHLTKKERHSAVVSAALHRARQHATAEKRGVEEEEQTQTQAKHKFRYCEMFAGIGGFRLAMYMYIQKDR